MAQFLTTNGISHHIEQIIASAEKSLVLITPYLDVSRILLERLQDAAENDVDITIVYGKKTLKEKEKEKLEKLPSLKLFFCKYLHAKSYSNENQLIVTSMNLYEFSEKNNREIGILMDKDEDNSLFSDAMKEVNSIIKASELIRNKEKFVLDKMLYLEPPFLDEESFYKPCFAHILSYKFKKEFLFDPHSRELICGDFPIDKVDFTVSHRIDFTFEDESLFNYLKYEYSDIVEKLSGEIRCYWNYNVINIYFPKNMEFDVSMVGLKVVINLWLDFLISFVDVITDGLAEYKTISKLS